MPRARSRPSWPARSLGRVAGARALLGRRLVGATERRRSAERRPGVLPIGNHHLHCSNYLLRALPAHHRTDARPAWRRGSRARGDPNQAGSRSLRPQPHRRGGHGDPLSGKRGSPGSGMSSDGDCPAEIPTQLRRQVSRTLLGSNRADHANEAPGRPRQGEREGRTRQAAAPLVQTTVVGVGPGRAALDPAGLVHRSS
jgi:hypothetical protein